MNKDELLNLVKEGEGFARDLGMAFAYTSNGHDIIEWMHSLILHEKSINFPAQMICGTGGS